MRPVKPPTLTFLASSSSVRASSSCAQHATTRGEISVPESSAHRGGANDLTASSCVEPSEKTQSLYVGIKQGQVRPALGGAPLPVQDLLAPIAILVEPIHSDLPPSFAYVAPKLGASSDECRPPQCRKAAPGAAS